MIIKINVITDNTKDNELAMNNLFNSVLVAANLYNKMELGAPIDSEVVEDKEEQLTEYRLSTDIEITDEMLVAISAGINESTLQLLKR